jgi:SAM-dependent methyltransferase
VGRASGSGFSHSRVDAPVIYQHPLAYLLGPEGIALLRAFSGVYDRDFTIARLREIQALLDSAEELGEGVEARPMTTREGYARWAPFYDEPGNQLLDLEQPVIREILDSLPLGVALDAACGTGRHTAYLASLGHEVIGVDTSPEMLARARETVPEGEFYEADLHDLPLADDSVDVVVCAIALSHVPELAPALTEFVRVLRPNGHLVISDSRGLIGDIGLPLVKIGPDGEFGYMRTYARLASD